MCEIKIRLAIEEYVVSNRDEKNLQCLENLFRINVNTPAKRKGTYLLTIPQDLVRQIYQLGDLPLIELFEKYYPAPTKSLFDINSVPEIILAREKENLDVLKNFDLDKVEPAAIKMQRRFRERKRKSEELNRIEERDKSYLKEKKQGAQELIEDANTPYRPKCSPELADRILNAARQVAAFSTVKHITHEKYLQNILDDGLYGRRMLKDFYKLYTEAALHETDIENGDGNVICLGPHEIDPKAKGEIIIEFDLPKLLSTKPAAFFKQKDLEFALEKVREVNLGNQVLEFQHTDSGFMRLRDPGFSYFKLYFAKNSLITQLPKSILISYNLNHIHEVLALNFFRFLDSQIIESNNLSAKIIYQEISQLNDEELLLFLTDLEREMTDTAEFNFYGAHKIDFSTVKSISNRNNEYSLHFDQFIEALNEGEIDELRNARLMIPNLFQSYRFLDYLLGQTNHLEARYYLDDLRKACNQPAWVSYIPLPGLEETFEIQWQIKEKPKCSKLELPEDNVETITKKLASGKAPLLKVTTQNQTNNFHGNQGFFNSKADNQEQNQDYPLWLILIFCIPLAGQLGFLLYKLLDCCFSLDTDEVEHPRNTLS